MNIRKLILDFFQSFFALLIGGSFFEVLLDLMSQTPNPFLSQSLISFLKIILPSAFDISSLVISFILAILYSYFRQRD